LPLVRLGVLRCPYSLSLMRLLGVLDPLGGALTNALGGALGGRVRRIRFLGLRLLVRLGFRRRCPICLGGRRLLFCRRCRGILLRLGLRLRSLLCGGLEAMQVRA
jgi:hypothetical protein